MQNHPFSSTSLHYFFPFKAMEETKIFKYSSFFLTIILLISIVFLNGAKSEVYTVGDDEEWNSGINYLKWSEKYNFSVGDVLVFKYVKGQHDAYEVTEAVYKSCNGSSGVLAKYKSGNDEIKLAKAKKYWFICNITGHCLGGMRFGIDVKEARDTSSNTNTTNGAPIASAMVPTPLVNIPNKCYASKRPMGIFKYLVAFGILLKMYC